MLRRLLRTWFPHPLLSLTLLMIWLLLNNSLGLGNLLLGTVLALTLSRLTANFWPERPHILKPLKLLRYLVQLFFDILIANLQVAVLILGPRKRLRPTFVELPLELTDPFAITVLASVISLTPGTVSADVIPAAEATSTTAKASGQTGDPPGNPSGAILLVHSLDASDPAALLQQLKQRYEAPLLEIFR
ncbi:Na+/H+ antiporter subunit E [Rhabdochromatium marinum]|uniref:Na+/H+ antiporter subunit E n=1 Tax=Rhabdochromatium marinum TaxID=48729 RepID=UPI001907F400|nr:Na+/H+ antiporter subunit E [Rhabdochromatium marinum]MBK1647988.1 Na+/H+ antiporter subunit E [Rhabdochromatium marinum]